MQKSIFLSLFLLIGISSFAQNDKSVPSDSLEKITSDLTKMFTTKISMNIDTLVFNQKMGNLYSSDKYKAFIFTLAIPQSIEQAEEHFEKEKKKKEFKLKEKGKMMVDGKEILYQKGIFKKDGKKLNMYIYAVKGDETTTIFISAIFLPEDESKLAVIIDNAVKTAKIDTIK